MPAGRPAKATFECGACNKTVPTYLFKPGAGVCVACWESSGQKESYVALRAEQHAANKEAKEAHALQTLTAALGGDIRTYFAVKKINEIAKTMWAATFCVCCRAKSYDDPNAAGHTFCAECQSMSVTGMCEKHQRSLD